MQGTPSSNVPGTPKRPSASVNPNNGTTTVQWEQPDLKGLPISGYVLRATSNNGQHSWQQQLPGDQTQMRIPGADGDQNGSLTYNRSYTFEVKAQTAAEGAFSPPSDLVAPYTGPAGIRITNKVRTGPQQWQYTVEATWRGKVGNIRAAGTAQGDKPGDGARTFDATVNWRGQGTASFQACLEGACTQAAQDSQSNPLPNVGNFREDYGSGCRPNPDIPGSQMYEPFRLFVSIDPNGSRQYMSNFRFQASYGYQPNDTQPNVVENPGNWQGTINGAGEYMVQSRRAEDNYRMWFDTSYDLEGYGTVNIPQHTFVVTDCPGG